MDQTTEKAFISIAHALFMNRLHLLRLTEVVRLGIKPERETGVMTLPEGLDREMHQLAIDFVLTCFPADLHNAINAAKTDWLRPA
jgi:hypothetical protein